MAKFNRSDVVTRMESSGVIPLFFHNDIKMSKKVLNACYNGGGRIVEFTNRGDFAHEIFSELNKYVRQELPEMMIGVGSVLDSETTAQFIQSGADFIVSPILNRDMAKICHRKNILWSPGCGTLTEIIRGHEMGADIVKIFPASQLGPGFIKAIKGPCPWLKLMPTGGVTAEKENLQAWFRAGATCVGMGSKLINKELINDGNLTRLKQHVANTLDLVKRIRNNS